MMEVFVNGIGAVGPGFNNWDELVPYLRGEKTWSHIATVPPAPHILPPAERRRTGVAVKVSLAAGVEAAERANASLNSLPTIFTSSGGDGDNSHALCESLAGSERLISPTRFHNSVHNATSGYWTIATGCMEQSTSLCAHDGSFSAGLLEAATQLAATGKPNLLIAFDSHYPEPLQTVRPMLDSMGIGMVLSRERQAASLARLRIGLAAGEATRMPDALEVLRKGAPTARALPMLAAIAGAQSTQLTLDYLQHLGLAVEVTPC